MQAMLKRSGGSPASAEGNAPCPLYKCFVRPDNQQLIAQTSLKELKAKANGFVKKDEGAGMKDEQLSNWILEPISHSS